MSKRIAISMRSDYLSSRNEYVDTISRDWHVFLNQVFKDILIIPLFNGDYDIENILNELKIDGIILSGGNDIGEDKHRDKIEFKIIDFATSNRLPLLGVCRGMQILNQYFGGKVDLNISKIEKTAHVNSLHNIQIVSSIFNNYSDNSEITVNSYHNHGVYLNNISKVFNVMATSDDALVEGIYHKRYPIIGLQWHVERTNPSTEFDKQIIDKLFKEGSFWK